MEATSNTVSEIEVTLTTGRLFDGEKISSGIYQVAVTSSLGSRDLSKMVACFGTTDGKVLYVGDVKVAARKYLESLAQSDWRNKAAANADKAKTLTIGTKVKINHPGREDPQGNPVHGVVCVVSSEPRGGLKQFLNVSVNGKFLVCENAANLEVEFD